MSVDIAKNQGEQTRAMVDRREAATVTNKGLKTELKRAAELRSVVGSQQDTEAKLRQYAAGRPLEAARIQRNAEVSIGNSSPNITTGARTETGEIGRHSSLMLSGEVLAEYTDAGNIDSVDAKGLNGTEKQRMQQQAIDAVLDVVKVLPQIEDIFKKPDGTPMTNIDDRRNLIKGLLNDPEFVAIVKQVANERMDPEKAQVRMAELAAKQIEAKRKHEAAKVDTTRKTDDQTAIVAKVTEVQRELGKYENTVGNTVDPLTARAQINKIDTVLSSILGGKTPEAFIAGKNTEVASFDGQILTIKGQLNNPSLDPALRIEFQNKATQLENDRVDADKLLKQAEALVASKQKLLDREVELRQAKADLEARELVARRAAEDAKRTELDAQADVNALQSERVALEQDLVAGASTGAVLTEAATRYLTVKGQEVADAQESRLQEELEKAKTEGEKKAKEALARRYEREETRGRIGKFLRGDRSYVIAKDVVEEDFTALLTAGGGTETLRVQLGIPKDQWDDGMEEFAIQRLIENKLQVGGLKEGEARIIYNSPWGGEIITKAIARKNELTNEVLGKLQASGDLKGQDVGSIREFIAKHPFLSPLLLAILFGVGAVALPALAATSVIGAAAGVTGGATGIGVGAGALGLGGTLKYATGEK